jgi:hypothetical protein
MDALEGLYGNLFHYLDDADIRERDPPTGNLRIRR